MRTQSLGGKIQNFIGDLREFGLPVSPGEFEDACQALMCVDWSSEAQFYQGLLSTLVKDQAYRADFDELYNRHFRGKAYEDMKAATIEELSMVLKQQGRGPGKGVGEGGEGEGKSDREGSKDAARRQKGRRDVMKMDFYDATYMGSPDDIKRMEETVPLLARKLASRMIMKRSRRDRDRLNFRRTVRASLSSGGVPVDLRSERRLRQRPIIFALCDVSFSCLQFSHFSLAMVYSLEKFFHQVRGFAFIGECDEVTRIIKQESWMRLRAEVLAEADVWGDSSYTDYGSSLESFLEKYGASLGHQSYVLIFGDARTNWFPARGDLLEKIKKTVKRVYWFNPEPESDWHEGDSSMGLYKRYCHGTFACTNLESLLEALCHLD